MGKTLYLECGSGISGDMMVAALLDLGAKEDILRDALGSLPLEGYELCISRVKKSGLDVCDFDVKLDRVHENHDHDMDYLHGSPMHVHEDGYSHVHEDDHGHVHEDGHSHMHEDGHNHVHEDSHSHMHEDGHSHDHGDGHSHTHGDAHNHDHVDGHAHTHEDVHTHGGHPVHEHRGIKEIQEIILQGKLTVRAREIALRTFDILAAAEAKAHGVPLEQVHFHEVGAVDSIVDIVAAAVCLDQLDITEVIVPVLNEGRGFVRCQHGVIPVPVPAVVNIAQAEGLPLHLTEIQGELVTPTGAAIVAAIRTSDQLPDSFQIMRVGMGAGKRTYERPSILRAMLLVKKN